MKKYTAKEIAEHLIDAPSLEVESDGTHHYYLHYADGELLNGYAGASFSTHVKVAFCKSALNASLGLNFRFTFLMLFALTSALVAAPPAEVSEMLKLPQSPSLTLSPASRWRSTTLRSWRKAIIASEGFSVVSSAMSIATWVSSTWAVVTCVGYHFFGPSGLLMSIFAIVLSRIVIVKKDFSSRPVSGCPDRPQTGGRG